MTATPLAGSCWVRGLVLFDFGGTLDADGTRWSVRFHDAYRAAGGAEPFAAFEPAFRASDRALERRTDIERLGFRAMVDAQTALLLTGLPDGARLSPRAIADRFHATTLDVVRRNEALLARLREAYHLGVVSNFSGNLEVCLQELGLMPYFTVVADSGRVGVTKPDKRLFQHALSRPGLRSPDAPAWMVGDNFASDIRPAAALGLSTAWLAPRTSKSPEAGLPTVHLTTLSQLAEVLDS